MLDLGPWGWWRGARGEQCSISLCPAGPSGVPSLLPPVTTATPHDPQRRPGVAQRPCRGQAGSAGSGAVGPRHRDGRVQQAEPHRAVGQRDYSSRAAIPTQKSRLLPWMPNSSARQHHPNPIPLPRTVPPARNTSTRCHEGSLHDSFLYHPVSLSKTLCAYLPSPQHSPPRAGSATASSSHRSAGTPPRSILTTAPPRGPDSPRLCPHCRFLRCSERPLPVLARGPKPKEKAALMSPAVPAHPPRRCQKSKVSKRGVVPLLFFFFWQPPRRDFEALPVFGEPGAARSGCSQRGVARPGGALRPRAHVVPPSRPQQSPTEAQGAASPGAV